MITTTAFKWLSNVVDNIMAITPVPYNFQICLEMGRDRKLQALQKEESKSESSIKERGTIMEQNANSFQNSQI